MKFDQNKMAFLNELAVATTALLAFLIVSSTFLGHEEGEPSKLRIAPSGSWIGADRLPPDRLLAQASLTISGPLIGIDLSDLSSPNREVTRYSTPMARISQVFAQFVPGESRKAPQRAGTG